MAFSRIVKIFTVMEETKESFIFQLLRFKKNLIASHCVLYRFSGEIYSLSNGFFLENQLKLVKVVTSSDITSQGLLVFMSDI